MIPTIKKSACLILSFVLILSGILMMPGNGLRVRATETTEAANFADLQYQINNSTSGQEIIIRGEISDAGSLFIPSGKDLTINLDGHSITVSSMNVDGAVTFEGNGTLTLATSSLFISGGTLTINNSIRIQKDSNSSSGVLVDISHQGTLIMNGGTLSASSAIAVACDDSTFTMNGGTVENSGSYSTIYLNGDGIFNMYGGTVSPGLSHAVMIVAGCFVKFGGTGTDDVFCNENGDICIVTYRVINGSWNDNTTADKTVTFARGDTDWLFSLTDDSIPTVGNKPGNGYTAGSWDVTPDANSTVSANVTYTYTYGGSGPAQSAPSRPSISENDASNYRPAPYISNKVGGYMAINGQLLPGVTMCKEKQGPACITVFNTARPLGWSEAFTFNMIVNGKTEHRLKNGTLTLLIPDEFKKAGRTFALIGVDKTGKPWTFADVDDDPDTITANINVEGYAFALIYKD